MSNHTSLAWRLISTESNILKKGSLKENDILQLRGIFLSLDEDKDGLLTTAQLGDALKLLGFVPREKLIKKFAVNMNQMKIRGLNEMSFKTDFKTFVMMLSKEMKALQDIDTELTHLFSFIDTTNSGLLSKSDLKHLLVDTITPLSMTPQEFHRFVKGLSFATDSENVRIVDLKKQLLFGGMK